MEAIRNMHSQVDQISPVVVEVKIEVPWAKVNENLEGAYRNLQRTARVRGFRPGKVPRNVVKSLLGKSVEREVTTRLMEEGLAEAVREHSLEPVAMADVDPPAIAQGQPLSFTAKLEVKPKIDAIDTSSLVVQRKLDDVTDAEVEQEIERLREQNAELVTPEPPRPARKGDILTLKIDVSVDGKPRPDLSSDDSRAELGSERLLAEIEAGLAGAKVGETKEITLTFPEDYGHEPLRGQAAVFSVQVKDMQEKVLPEVDDDFARDLEHDSLDALRKDILKRLHETAERRAEAQVREQVVDKLVDANPIPVPPSLIERQQHAMMNELFQLQQMLGRPIPFDDQMQSEMQQRAERKIRAGLLFGAMADQQKIEVSDEDLEARMKEIADQSGKHVAKVRAEYQGERRDSLRSQLLQNKLLEYLLSRATITDAGPNEPEGEPKAPKAAKAKPEGEEKAAAKKPKTEAKAKTQAKAKTEAEAEAKTESRPKKTKAATKTKKAGKAASGDDE
jgi:trigger factor